MDKEVKALTFEGWWKKENAQIAIGEFHPEFYHCWQAAHAAGKREGLEEAAKVAESSVWHSRIAEAIAVAIRALMVPK
jgi:hypothetical protein